MKGSPSGAASAPISLRHLAAIEVSPLLAPVLLVAGVLVMLRLIDVGLIAAPALVLLGSVILPVLFLWSLFGSGSGWMVVGRTGIGVIIGGCRVVALLVTLFFAGRTSTWRCGNECGPAWYGYLGLTAVGVALVIPVVSAIVLVAVERGARRAPS
jgi:hypothetical protein